MEYAKVKASCWEYCCFALTVDRWGIWEDWRRKLVTPFCPSAPFSHSSALEEGQSSLLPSIGDCNGKRQHRWSSTDQGCNHYEVKQLQSYALFMPYQTFALHVDLHCGIALICHIDIFQNDVMHCVVNNKDDRFEKGWRDPISQITRRRLPTLPFSFFISWHIQCNVRSGGQWKGFHDRSTSTYGFNQQNYIYMKSSFNDITQIWLYWFHPTFHTATSGSHYSRSSMTTLQFEMEKDSQWEKWGSDGYRFKISIFILPEWSFFLSPFTKPFCPALFYRGTFVSEGFLSEKDSLSVS